MKSSSKSRNLAFSLAMASAALLTIGCGGDEAAQLGSLHVHISGEEAAKTGFPFEEDGVKIEFADGYTLSFSKVLVSFGSIGLRGAEGDVGVASTDSFVADLHAGDPEVATFEDLPARRWEKFGFELKAPDAKTKVLGTVAAADVQTMVDGGFNYWIEGSATKANETYTFVWGLKNPTRNVDCTNGLDGTAGLVIRENATSDAEITIHMDHFFWDTLGSEGASLRFEAIAGAAGADKMIQFDELASQNLADLKAVGGMPLVDASGNPVVYNPGSVPLAKQDLRSFVLAASAGMGHLNGEGLCTVGAL